MTNSSLIKKVIKLKHVLVIHGLNQSPVALNDLNREIRKKGGQVHLLKLMGHDGDIQALKSAKSSHWIEQVESELYRIEKLKKGEDTLHVVGYSLGGILAMLVGEMNKPYLNSLLLLAPAMTPQPFGKIVNFIPPVFNLLVPSLTRSSQRLYMGAPLSSYRQVYQIATMYNQSPPSWLQQQNVAFVLDQKDELVSYSQFSLWYEKYKSEKWILKILRDKKGFHHQITNPKFLDQESWKVLKSQIDWLLG